VLSTLWGYPSCRSFDTANMHHVQPPKPLLPPPIPQHRPSSRAAFPCLTTISMGSMTADAALDQRIEVRALNGHLSTANFATPIDYAPPPNQSINADPPPVHSIPSHPIPSTHLSHSPSPPGSSSWSWQRARGRRRQARRGRATPCCRR
jgi:hypothetical protein